MKYPALIPLLSLCALSYIHAQETADKEDAPFPANDEASTTYDLPSMRVEGIRINGDEELPGSRILDRVLMESWDIDNLGKLTSHLPSISFEDTNSGGYGNQLRYRGTVNTPYFSDPAVAIYVDGVPVGKAFSMPILLPLIEDSVLFSRAETLKSGRNSQGAVLYLRTPDPLTSPYDSQLGTSINDDGDFSIDARHTLTLSDSTALSLQIHEEQEDGWVYNSTLDQELGDQESRFAQGSLSGILGEDSTTSWDLRLTWTDRDQDGLALVPIGQHDTVERTGLGGVESEYAKASFSIGANTDEAIQWSSITAWQSWELAPYSTWLVVALGPEMIVPLASELSQHETFWTQELHLDYSWDTFTWRNGLFLSRSESGGEVARSMAGVNVFEQNSFDWTEDTINLFSNLSYEKDQLTIQGGLKWENVSKDLVRTEVIPAPGVQVLHKSFTQLLPFLELDYRIDPEWTAFATISETYRPGGFSSFTGNEALMPFGKETVDQVEAGIRWNHPENGFAQLNLFYQDIDGYQVERSFTETEYLVVNADQLTSQGLELIAGSTLAGSLNWEASISWNDTEFDSYTDPFTGMDFSGQRPPAVPEYDGHISLWWKSDSPWSTGVDWTFQGKRYFSEDNNDMLAINAHEELGAFISYHQDDWTITLAARNLLNETYYQNIIPGVYHAVPAKPRSVMLKFTWKR